MKIAIVNNYHPDDLQFCETICSILAANKVQTQIIPDPANSQNKCSHEDISAVILSASPRGDDIVAKRVLQLDWLIEYDRPILGICAGHQILSVMFGGYLLKNTHSEDGIYEITITHDDDLFLNTPRTFAVKHAHNDSVTVPLDFSTLACSQKCPNQAMRHRTKNIYSVQYHAELSHRELFFNFASIVEKSASAPLYTHAHI